MWETEEIKNRNIERIYTINCGNVASMNLHLRYWPCKIMTQHSRQKVLSFTTTKKTIYSMGPHKIVQASKSMKVSIKSRFDSNQTEYTLLYESDTTHANFCMNMYNEKEEAATAAAAALDKYRRFEHYVFR